MSGSGPDWRPALEAAFDDAIRSASSVPGGDIGESFRVQLDSGRNVFVKHYREAPEGIAGCEARGLAWLAEGESSLRVASPLAHGSDWLALEWIESHTPVQHYDVALGEGLAALHAASPPCIGLGESNWIGPLPQSNEAKADWSEFYGIERLLPMQRRAHDAGHLPKALERQLDRLIEELPSLIGPEEAIARLHGDLWSGNILPDERGLPCLVDPACYGGHREVDLAMMKLFGGFGQAVFDAYERAYPLSTGADTRVSLYQVYPLLVHVCLFGSGYVDRLARAVEAALVS